MLNFPMSKEDGHFPVVGHGIFHRLSRYRLFDENRRSNSQGYGNGFQSHQVFHWCFYRIKHRLLYKFSISPIVLIMKQRGFTYLLNILNQIQHVNQQKRMEKQSAREHVIVLVLMQQGVMLNSWSKGSRACLKYLLWSGWLA